MELIELGMDRWFQDHVSDLCEPDQRIARVMVVDRGQYIVRDEQGDMPAKATRKFMVTKKASVERPCVGDWVCMDFQDSEQYASIHTVLPRKSFLRRKSAGKSSKLQMIAANLDMVFIVQSCHYDFNVRRLERYLVMAKEGDVESLLVLTKTDLVSEKILGELISEIRDAGINIRIIALSNKTGEGVGQFKEVMSFGKTYCLVGSSGVGKSTLINQISGHNALKTGSVSNSGEGRHTTVRRQLIVLEQGAMLIDTPGMREVGLLGISKDVDRNFDAIEELSRSCRFANCSHTKEPGCAVLQAIKRGKLSQKNYQNYIKVNTEGRPNRYRKHRGQP